MTTNKDNSPLLNETDITSSIEILNKKTNALIANIRKINKQLEDTIKHIDTVINKQNRRDIELIGLHDQLDPLRESFKDHASEFKEFGKTVIRHASIIDKLTYDNLIRLDSINTVSDAMIKLQEAVELNTTFRRRTIANKKAAKAAIVTISVILTIISLLTAIYTDLFKPEPIKKEHHETTYTTDKKDRNHKGRNYPPLLSMS